MSIQNVNVTSVSARNLWFVRQSGNDANNGASAASAFGTAAKAISVATVGDIIVFGRGFDLNALSLPSGVTAISDLLPYMF